MSIPEDKKITINLPRLEWSLILNLRFGIALLLVAFAASFGYWYNAVRPYLWLSGARVEAFSLVVSCDTAGRIIEMGFQEGDLVKRGQTLLSLDRNLIISKQEQAKRSVASISEQVELEKERFGRALEDYLSATTELEIGIGSEDKVKRQLNLMEESQEKSDAALSHLAAVQSTISELDLEFKKTTLSAPFDGIILKKSKNPGAVISFGEPLYLLCDPDRMWIEAEIPETEISRVVLGAPVRIQLPAYPDKELSGKVSWIGPATVAKSSLLPFSEEGVAVPIRISIETPGFALKPGLSAYVGLRVR